MNRLDLRFAIGWPDGPRSHVWRAWSWRNDVYLATRSMARIEKLSFHESGICRSAFTAEHGTPASLNDRATTKWRRFPTPAKNEGWGSKVAEIIIPTDFLSTEWPRPNKAVIWITPAPSNEATVLELMFVNETADEVCRLFSEGGHRDVVSYSVLPNGEAIVFSSRHQKWENSDLHVPGDGKVNDLIFSSSDPFRTGRPIRLTCYKTPADNDAITMIELGGYAISRQPV